MLRLWGLRSKRRRVMEVEISCNRIKREIRSFCHRFGGTRLLLLRHRSPSFPEQYFPSRQAVRRFMVASASVDGV
jgi:hypothetical protein